MRNSSILIALKRHFVLSGSRYTVVSKNSFYTEKSMDMPGLVVHFDPVSDYLIVQSCPVGHYSMAFPVGDFGTVIRKINRFKKLLSL